MKISMSYAFRLLYNSPYHGLFYLSEILDLPIITEKDRYPRIEYLRINLRRTFKLTSPKLINSLKFSKIQLTFLKMISTEPWVEWSIADLSMGFLSGTKIHDLIKGDMNSFGLKLLYFMIVFAWSLNSGLIQALMYRFDYTNWYKEYNIDYFGKRNDSYDQ